jgi:dihydrolipoamide dehydrogenase
MTKKVVIVGGGPGGYVAAIRAAQLGAEVHLVEAEHLGGTCLNVGCIPTKAMLHAAETFEAMQNCAGIGLKISGAEVDWPGVIAYKARVVERLVSGVAGLLKANGVIVHRGHADLREGRRVGVGGTALEADAVVLAVGSEPARPKFAGAELPGVIDSAAALNLPVLPESIAILGGGVIGIEFASMFSAFGCRVSVIEMLPQILPGVDGEIAQAVHESLAKKGLGIFTDARLTEVAGRRPKLDLAFSHGGAVKALSAEILLVAVGRRPRTQGMGLEAAGVAMERGRIVVDGHFLTSVPGVYAIGDCSSAVMLAHVASAQGTAAVEHALGHATAYYGEIVPACIYTHPEVASVGLSEEQARARGLAYKTGVFPLSGNGKSLIESDGVGLVKVLAGAKHGEILGVHIFGPRATDLITEAALAMRLEATVDELVSTIHAHPTVGEAMAEAALAVGGAAIHWPPRKARATVKQ